MPLIDSAEPGEWQAALASYPKALDVLLARKQDPSKLQALEEWLRDPKKSAEQKTVLDRATLSKIVEWKLSRGTFRPGLLQKAQSNDEATVKEAYRQARELILAEEASDGGDGSAAPPGLLEAAAKAIKAMDKSLFGVGPATASAVLARCFPHAVAFMSDEAMLGCGLFASPAALKYDMKTFKRFNEVVQGKARALNAKSRRRDWTGDGVARALWAEYVLARAAGAAGGSAAGVRAKPAAAPAAAARAAGAAAAPGVKKTISKK